MCVCLPIVDLGVIGVVASETDWLCAQIVFVCIASVS